MNQETLITMANQIGAFFESQGTHEEAVAGIADHLKRFWERRMLQSIGDFVNAGGDALEESGLHAAVAEAVRRLVPPAGAGAGAGAASVSPSPPGRGLG